MEDLQINQEQTQEQPEVNPSALGQSEHDQKMIEIAEGRMTPEGKEIPQEEPQQPERDQSLPEKFNSVEDLASAYKELEKKLGSQNQPQEETVEEEPQSLNQDKYVNEFIENGGLTEESYKELEAKGFDRSDIDGYLEYLYNKESVSGQQILDTVGGRDNYDQLVEWAETNADQNIVEAYNAALDRGDVNTASTLISVLSQDFTKNNGEFGTRVSATPTAPTSDVFGSQVEITQAMSDPRYSGSTAQRDPAYIQEVERKIARSKF